MFAVIRSNQRKSVALIALIGLVLLAVGYALGLAVDPALGPAGLGVAAVIWAVMMAVSLAGGEALLLRQAGAREIRKADSPRLFNIVEEMQLAAGLAHTPRVYLIDAPQPNAFAVGRTEERAAVAVTTGLLARLNRDELQGVVAHELAHIRNRDTLFMTLAGTTMGAIILLADFYVRGLRFRNASRRSSSGNGRGAGALILIAVVLAILAPLLARLLYFACSRRREYLADACAAQFTRYPEGLASALEKLASQQDGGDRDNRVLAPLYIVNPSAASGTSGNWFSTHPPLADRVHVLRGMAGGASLTAYENSYRKLHGQRGILGVNLRGASDVAARPALAEVEPPALPPRWRDARGSLHEADGLRVLDCPCGVRLRIPPGLGRDTLPCPRCGHVHRLDGPGGAAGR